MKSKLISLFAFLSVFIFHPFEALAYEPKPGGIGFQPAATPNMERIRWFHDDLMMIIITGIVALVLALLVIVIVRFNARTNKEPAKFTHNLLIEVLWTAAPLVILLIIVIPSFSLLNYNDRAAEYDMTLEVSGYQWGWTYSYPDQEIDPFNADMIPDEELDTYIPGSMGRRTLETYNPIVLPINQNIEVLTKATDVIHSWAMPAFGVKKDAVPGRMNSTWFRVTEPGVYFGQCSEICGINHAFMPIAVYAIPEEEFNAWVDCVKADEAGALYPARQCVQDLGLDKYRKGGKNKTEFATLNELKIENGDAQ